MNCLIATSIFLATSSWPIAAQEMGYGESEFINSCALCHGVRGKGDGPLATELQTAPSDLSLLSERNGDEFPFQLVMAIIDGRHIVPGHGEREMPVWGREFLESDQRTYGATGGEAVTQERVHQLAEYIQTLQR
ncbi:cytochrome C [Aminobacter sp. DSM 101952]|uniref:c-type cytochrome n=1 Tax=Aminobacter TaxID=31988 RepID=UPI0006FFF2E4|nr:MULTISPECIES: c-type cytochrome [Aminobacter]AWC23729.1 Cytochrome c, mono- and diheme variant [Aminobacter sp. MSH1]KQU70046.1 cytochrome C [Aminobacter sp. DSM 101952]CAI2934410.1 Cytochrome C [Aminobacter niigataensis]